MHSHSSYHHYYGRSSTTRYGSESNLSTTSAEPAIITPASITTPIVYDMNAGTTDIKFEKPSLVVVVNNMVIYGEMVDDQHIVMIINEDFEQPNDIPLKFLLSDTESDEDDDLYLPWSKRTTTTSSPELTTNEEFLAKNVSSTVDVPRNQTNIDTTSEIDGTQVLNNQWFSDIDGGNK